MNALDLAKLVERAGGAQILADLLGVGKDWVYRRLNGQTPIKRKDERIIEGLADTLEPQAKKE